MTKKPSFSDGFFALRDHCFAVFYKVSLPGDCHVALLLAMTECVARKESSIGRFAMT